MLTAALFVSISKLASREANMPLLTRMEFGEGDQQRCEATKSAL